MNKSRLSTSWDSRLFPFMREQFHLKWPLQFAEMNVREVNFPSNCRLIPLMRSRKCLRTLEQLEDRRVFASDWQNPRVAPRTSTVRVASVPLDVLLIANDINQNGIRTLPATKPVGYADRYVIPMAMAICVSLDALQVVNAINQFPNETLVSTWGSRKLAIAMATRLCLMSQRARYAGTSTPNVSVKVERLDGQQATVIHSGTVWLGRLSTCRYSCLIQSRA